MSHSKLAQMTSFNYGQLDLIYMFQWHAIEENSIECDTELMVYHLSFIFNERAMKYEFQFINAYLMQRKIIIGWLGISMMNKIK